MNSASRRRQTSGGPTACRCATSSGWQGCPHALSRNLADALGGLLHRGREVDTDHVTDLEAREVAASRLGVRADFDERVAQSDDVCDGGYFVHILLEPQDAVGPFEVEAALETGAVDRYRTDPAYIRTR